MISITKSLLAVAPLVSLALASKPPAPVSPVRTSQPVSSPKSGIQADNASGGNCDHCYTCYFFEAPQGSKFLAFVGNMVVPSNNPDNSQATNFVWPGLENNASGNDLFVLQPVLNGFPAQNGEWSTFENYLVGSSYGDTQGNSVSTSIGESLSFSMTINSDSSGWGISSNGATNNYPITQDLTQALFCGEFYSSNWDFGDLVFTDVQIVASGSDSSWCVENGQSTLGSPTGQWEGVSSSTDENGNTVCNISKLTMNSN